MNGGKFAFKLVGVVVMVPIYFYKSIGLVGNRLVDFGFADGLATT